MRCISLEQIELYRVYLISEERAALTVEKYIRDVTAFCRWVSGKNVTKERVVEYKALLVESYAPGSVNSVISSLMSFFAFLGWNDLKVKSLKIQRRIFDSEEKELTKAEYQRLLQAAKAKQNERLICFFRPCVLQEYGYPS